MELEEEVRAWLRSNVEFHSELDVLSIASKVVQWYDQPSSSPWPRSGLIQLLVEFKHRWVDFGAMCSDLHMCTNPQEQIRVKDHRVLR